MTSSLTRSEHLLPDPREHMAQWLGGQSSITKEMRDDIRDLNAYTSQTVFAGESGPLGE